MLTQGTVFAEKYQIVQLIGKGGMGSVYLAEDMDDHTQWAIKEELLNKSSEQLLRQETTILSKLNHPLLPKVYKSFETGGKLYIVMEFVKGQTLENLLNKVGKIPEFTALKWFQQICDVLVYLHGLDVPVVYRDLKPSNIMIQLSGDVKIIDFGIAQEYKKAEKAGKNVMALTKGYAAPEQYDNKYMDDVRTDIYALGVTMHYMLTGKNPNRPPFYFRPVRKLNPSLSYAVEYIVGKCLQPNPDKRYNNALELHKELENIHNLENTLRRKRRRKMALSVTAGLSVLCVAVFIFAIVKKQRNDTIDVYYQYLIQAQEYGESNAYEDAMRLYETAIGMQPEAWDAYLGKAKLYLLQGKFEDCHAWLKKTAEKFPDIFETEEFLKITEELYENTTYEEEK